MLTWQRRMRVLWKSGRTVVRDGGASFQKWNQGKMVMVWCNEWIEDLIEPSYQCLADDF